MIPRISLRIMRLLLGNVFVFSGFAKAIDPLGGMYKMQDYLEAMGGIFTAFAPLAIVPAILLSAIELAIGLSLIFGVRLKEANIGAALLMLFMTPLTLWIALTDPVHDCGCFGDALVISNWATFWKNIVIDIIIIMIFALHKHHKSAFGQYAQWAVAAYGFFFALALSAYCYTHLPLIDFRPYKIGVNITRDMQLPPDAVKDSAVYTVVYAKNGAQQEFALDNMPDSTWQFVESKRTVIRKGDEPKIKDFIISGEDGEITDIILENKSYTFLLISEKLEKVSPSKADRINAIYNYARANGYAFYAVTSSVEDEIIRYQLETGAEYPIVSADNTLLKTIIRSNPGLLLLKDAEILNKWHARNLPQFDRPLDRSPLGELQTPDTGERIFFTALLYLLPLLLIFGVDKVLNNRRD